MSLFLRLTKTILNIWRVFMEINKDKWIKDGKVLNMPKKTKR